MEQLTLDVTDRADLRASQARIVQSLMRRHESTEDAVERIQKIP
jgi:hypothetical protein